MRLCKLGQMELSEIKFWWAIGSIHLIYLMLEVTIIKISRGGEWGVYDNLSIIIIFFELPENMT